MVHRAADHPERIHAGASWCIAVTFTPTGVGDRRSPSECSHHADYLRPTRHLRAGSTALDGWIPRRDDVSYVSTQGRDEDRSVSRFLQIPISPVERMPPSLDIGFSCLIAVLPQLTVDGPAHPARQFP